jgi:hypothetical protein
LSRPVFDGIESLRIGEVEDDDYCVAVFIVESEERSEPFLAGSVPNVHGEGFPASIVGLVAVEAGSEGVAGFFVEGSVQEDLDDAGLSDV